MFQYLSIFDGDILLFIQAHLRTPIITPIFKFLSDIGNDGLIWLAVISILFFIRKSRRIGLVALITLIICFIINNIMLKNLIARPRPFDMMTSLQVLISKPTDYSFPSGHTASSFAAAGAFYFNGNKKWGFMAFILAAMIGFSRLYLGVHYPSDVICGALTGLVISFLTSLLFIDWLKKSTDQLID